MKRTHPVLYPAFLLVACPALILAQTGTRSATAVPRLVRFAGTLTGASGQPLTAVLGVTFAVYDRQEGGAPVWMENQNVQPDEHGDYSVLLGATRNEVIPAEVFASAERWLGIQVAGEPERPRVLLTSVPYSLKAVDAETLGGCRRLPMPWHPACPAYPRPSPT